MAEGILCNCLEAISRLQSWLQYLSILCADIHMHTWLSHHYQIINTLVSVLITYTITQNIYTTSTYATSIVALHFRGGEHGGAEGAIAPPCFKVEGQCPPTFPYLTLLLSTNIIHLHLLQVIQLLEVGLLQSMHYHHYNSRSYALMY